MADQRPIARLLTRLCRGRNPDDAAALTAEAVLAVCAMGQDHGVVSLLHQRIHQSLAFSLLPAPIRESLTTTVRNTAHLNLRRQAALAEMLAALNAQMVPTIVLKGAFLAVHVYRDLVHRQMLDIDLLVHERDLAKAADTLRTLGYSTDRPTAAGGEMAKHLRPLKREGVGAVELHWSLTGEGSSTSIAPAPLWSRARPAAFLGVTAYGLSPEDLLLHIAFHATYDHQFGQGVRPMLDLAAVIDRYGDQLEWAGVVANAREWGWQRGVGLALSLAADWAEADVPPDVLAEIGIDRGESIYSVAEQQMATAGQVPLMRRTVTALAGQGTLGGARYAVARLFPAPGPVAKEYGVGLGSFRFWSLYARDVAARVARHAPTLSRWQLHGEADLETFAHNQNRLNAWLADETRRSAAAPGGS